MDQCDGCLCFGCSYAPNCEFNSCKNNLNECYIVDCKRDDGIDEINENNS